MATRKLAEQKELAALHQRFNRILADQQLTSYLRDDVVKNANDIQDQYAQLSIEGELPELVAFNRWVDKHISSKGWTSVRTALRNKNHKAKANLTSVSMEKSAAALLTQCSEKLGINDITTTVRFLAELADQHLEKKNR